MRACLGGLLLHPELCLPMGKVWCYRCRHAGNARLEKLLNRGLGWEGENCAIEAVGVKPTKTGI